MENILNLVIKTLDDKKAFDITRIDFNKGEGVCDHFVIASALNDRHARSLIDEVEDKLLENKISIKAIDSEKDAMWYCIDIYDVMVHIFTGEYRDNYALEKLWADQTIIKM